MTNIEICEVTHDISLNDFSAMSEFKIAIARAVLEAAHPKPAAPIEAGQEVSDALSLDERKLWVDFRAEVEAGTLPATTKRRILALRSGASAQPAGGAK